jgi:hypothetical protein
LGSSPFPHGLPRDLAGPDQYSGTAASKGEFGFKGLTFSDPAAKTAKTVQLDIVGSNCPRKGVMSVVPFERVTSLWRNLWAGMSA